MKNYYRKHDLKSRARQPCSVFQNLFFPVVFLLHACIFSFSLWFTNIFSRHLTIQSPRPFKTIRSSFLITLLVTAIPTPWHSYMDNREYHNHATKLLPIAKFITAQLFWRTISFKTLYLHVRTFLFTNNSANHIVRFFKRRRACRIKLPFSIPGVTPVYPSSALSDSSSHLSSWIHSFPRRALWKRGKPS